MADKLPVTSNKKEDTKALPKDHPQPTKAQPAPQAADLKVSRKGFIEAAGEVIELLPGLKFRILLDTGSEITATMKGRMRRNRIQLITGDRVKVEISPYDLSKGRITYRF